MRADEPVRGVSSRGLPLPRQIGFLYLRFVGEPRSLWNWFEEFLDDKEARRAFFLLLTHSRAEPLSPPRVAGVLAQPQRQARDAGAVRARAAVGPVLL